MKESVFQAEWGSSFRAIPGVHFFKVPDQPRFSSETIRFAPVRPYDCYCIYKGRFIAMELKWEVAPRSFRFDKVSDHQIQYLRESKMAGGEGFISVNYRGSNISEKLQKKFSLAGSRLNLALVYDIDKFVEMSNEVDGKSISYDVMRDKAQLVISRSGGIWDVVSLLEYCLSV